VTRGPAVLAFALAACAAAPRRLEIEAARELGVLALDPSVHARDGGYSARLGALSVWVFGDSVLARAGADGSRWRSSTVAWTSDLDARDGLTGLADPLDAAGAPGEFLPFTLAEADYNARHFAPRVPERERSRWALWPGPLVVEPSGRALVFFAKLACGAGAWDFRSVGHGLAPWRGPGHAVERPAELLFPEGDAVLGQGAVLHGGWLYAYGCRTAGLRWPCIVARAPAGAALERAAWRFWNGRDWVAAAADAAPVLDAAPMLSVHWNAHLRLWLAAYSVPLVNRLALRTAPAPEGPWSEAVITHECVPAAAPDAWDYAGLAHAELAAEGGRVEFLSYYRPTGPLSGEMRLVEVRLR
jgi:hypothetical protein